LIAWPDDAVRLRRRSDDDELWREYVAVLL